VWEPDDPLSILPAETFEDLRRDGTRLKLWLVGYVDYTDRFQRRFRNYYTRYYSRQAGQSALTANPPNGTIFLSKRRTDITPRSHCVATGGPKTPAVQRIADASRAVMSDDNGALAFGSCATAASYLAVVRDQHDFMLRNVTAEEVSPNLE
jgi:hypothetical protein